MIFVGMVWLVLLVAWALELYVQERDGSVTDRGRPLLWTLGSVGAIATIGFGFCMGVRRYGFSAVLASAAVGAAALMSIYGSAWLVQPDPDFTNDNAAAVGFVMIGPPVLLIVLTLLGVGALAGRVISRTPAAQA